MSDLIIKRLGAEIDRSHREFDALKKAVENFRQHEQKFRIQSKQLERLAFMAGISVGLLAGMVLGAVLFCMWSRA